jgi:hypothetical protein
MYTRWAIYLLFSSFLIPGIDHIAQIGGFVAGILFGLIVSDMPAMTEEWIYFWKAVGALTFLVVVFGFVMVTLHHPA